MRESKTVNLIIQVVLWAFSIVFIYPLLMVLLTSFKSYGEANILSVSLPSQWMWENYAEVVEKGRIVSAFFNSVVVTVSSVALILLCASVISFVTTRRQNRFNRFFAKFLTFGIIAPFAALPTVQLLKAMGLYGSHFSVIMVYTALYIPFSSMLFSSFIVGIPRELDESATLDGAVGFRLFFRIIFPLLKPVTATTAILNFMWVWNDFQYPMYLLNSSSKWTLPLSVFNFYGTYNRSWNLVCADMVLVSIPVILLYIFAQKYVIAGMTAGAVKG